MWRRRPLPAAIALLLTVAALAPAAAGAAPTPRALTVGRLQLQPCADVEGAWCGRLRVPFDRADLGRHPRAAVIGTAGGARLAAILPAP
jgi:hypothetical protein